MLGCNGRATKLPLKITGTKNRTQTDKLRAVVHLLLLNLVSGLSNHNSDHVTNDDLRLFKASCVNLNLNV